MEKIMALLLQKSRAAGSELQSLLCDCKKSRFVTHFMSLITPGKHQ